MSQPKSQMERVSEEKRERERERKVKEAQMPERGKKCNVVLK